MYARLLRVPSLIYVRTHTIAWDEFLDQFELQNLKYRLWEMMNLKHHCPQVMLVQIHFYPRHPLVMTHRNCLHPCLQSFSRKRNRRIREKNSIISHCKYNPFLLFVSSHVLLEEMCWCSMKIQRDARSRRLHQKNER